nr:retrovirus-related Pol polyprotein from transposon TNT 1-94 [Tanacetum cinerariifolium]
MMVYLKNLAGFKMDFFKGMTYDEIRPIFKNHFNSIVACLEKEEKEIVEEASKMILLVERRYPLTRFTLDQMLNNVRLEIEEENEVSLELLRFMGRQQQEGYKPDVVVRETPEMALSKKKEKMIVEKRKGIDLLYEGNDEDDRNNEQVLSDEHNDQEKENEEDDDNEDEAKISNKAGGNEDEEMDYTTSQLYDDVDIRLDELVDTDEGIVQEDGTDAAKTNVQQGSENPEIIQVIKDAHSANTHTPYSTCLGYHKFFTSISIVIPQSLQSFTHPPQQSTSTPLPTTEAINPLSTLPDFALVFQFNNKVTTLEKEVAELKEEDPLKTQVTTLVDKHLDARLGATKDEFMSFLLALITARITKQLKNQLPQILPKKVSNFAPPVIQSMVIESLEQAILAKESSQPQSLYDQYNADIRATNILLQGLPKDIYTLINHHTDANDIWDNVKMLLEGSELTKEDQESQLYDDFEHFQQHKGETIHDYYVRFTKLINDIRNIKMTMSRMQLNSKFMNNMSPKWGRFVTAPALYNGHEILKDNHARAKVHNTEDTLEIAEITRKKMNDKMTDPECVTHKVKIATHDYSKENLLATFTPQKQLIPEQIYWSNDLMNLKSKALKEWAKVSRLIKAFIVYPSNTPATLVPRVLPTTSQVKIYIFTL